MKNENEILGQGFNLEIEGILSCADLENLLRNVCLTGDANLKPYRDSTIRIYKSEIANLRPLSYYVLDTQIQIQKKICPVMKDRFGIDIFDLTGAVDYRTDQGIFRISPPVVERYFESQEGREISVIVDGIHRVWLARELGIRHVGVIEITGIHDEFPLVPLPLDWSDVYLTNTVPEVKRKYRFPNSENPYFFFRDLSPLGSKGIRIKGSNS